MAEERKLVTILFADVTGSTALGESLDPEDVRALMGRYYAHAQRVIPDHGGTLEKFIGDAVMAVFGLPRVHGNDAERALAAALALREAVTTDTLLTGRLLLRIGINTGEVVATSDPSISGDFLVTGDAVNVAARLQQGANPGEIVAGERTANAAQASFLFGNAGLVEVKGKRNPLRVFPLEGARPVRRATRPPLVGRRQELLQLSVLQMRVLEEGRPELVSIVAPAGTGKTRLLEEFIAQLDPADGFQVATAHFPPYGQTLTYWPLRGLLSDLLEGEIAHERLVEAFVQDGHLPEDAFRLTDLVFVSMGIEREEVADRESIFAAWRLLVEALARQTPHIIIFEDLHWASDLLLDLVEQLMQSWAQVPLLIIAISRPELLDRRPIWGGGRQSFTALALQPLRETQTRVLVEGLTTGLSEMIREQIVARSGGNPFFAIELARGLAERSRAGNVALPEVLPDTVHEATLARLDLVSPRERVVMQVASVVGQDFRAATLHAVLDTLELTELKALLHGLLARDLIVFSEHSVFTFCHILIREVVYGTLSRSERVRIHCKIAVWLEESTAGGLDEFTELIAYHYQEAVRISQQSSVPLELPVDLARVVHSLERAAMLASRSGALAEARTYLQRALELAAEEEHLRLYERLGDAVLQGDTAVDAYRKAVGYWRKTEGQDPLVGARLLRKLLISYTRWNLWDVQARPTQEELVGLLVEARRLAEAAGDEDECWRVRLAVIRLLIWSGNSTVQEADEGRVEALALAAHFEERSDWISFSAALDGYTVLSFRVGAHHDALDASRRRLSVPEIPVHERADALQVMAVTYLNLGNFSHCIEVVREALVHLRPGDPVVHLDAAVVAATWALLLNGPWSEISTFMPTLEDIWKQIQHGVGATTHVAGSYLAILHIALAREDLAAASAAASVLERCFSGGSVNARALLDAYRFDDPHYLDFDPSSDEWTLPILLFLNERGIPARRTLMARLRTLGFSLSMDLWIRFVEIAEALENSDMIRLTTAIDEIEAHGYIAHAARVRLVLAQRTGDQTQLERARLLLERLGDRQFLRRLEEVSAALGKPGKSW